MSVDGINVDTLPVEEVPNILMGRLDSMVELKFSRPVETKLRTPRKHGSGTDGALDWAGLSVNQRRSEESASTKWASCKMQSFAPTYETVQVMNELKQRGGKVCVD